MIKYFIKYRVVVAIMLVFVPLLFLFLHSELGLLNVELEHHTTHDYCYLVDNTTAQTVIQLDLPQLKVESSFCFHCIQEIETNEILTTAFEYNDFRYPQKTSEIYLHNRTLRI